MFSIIFCPKIANYALCFYDTNLIEMSLMTEDEIDWLNAYHVRVYKETAPLLNAEEQQFLARKCAALEIKN